MKLWKFYLLAAVAVAVVAGIPAAIYVFLKEPPGVATTVDVFTCNLVNMSGTLVLDGACRGRYVQVSTFVINSTYLKYAVDNRLKLETYAEDLWRGMTTVGDVVSDKTKIFRVGNETYRTSPENLIPPPLRAALARLVEKHPWLAESYLVNGEIFRGLVWDPVANQKVVGYVFTALQPMCSRGFTSGPGGGVINKYDACWFTALILVNKSKLVVLDVSVKLTNIENSLEISDRGGAITIRGRAIGLLMQAIQNATKQLEEVISK
ncbi:MAG: hypothetical protein ACPL3C_01615 [Pyrobaculum sp.]